MLYEYEIKILGAKKQIIVYTKDEFTFTPIYNTVYTGEPTETADVSTLVMQAKLALSEGGDWAKYPDVVNMAERPVNSDGIDDDEMESINAGARGGDDLYDGGNQVEIDPNDYQEMTGSTASFYEELLEPNEFIDPNDYDPNSQAVPISIELSDGTMATYSGGGGGGGDVSSISGIDNAAKYVPQKTTVSTASIKAAKTALVNAWRSAGVTNKYVLAAVLACCYKECGFAPKNESYYGTTSIERIRKIFGSSRWGAHPGPITIDKDGKQIGQKVPPEWSDVEILYLSKNYEAFFNWIFDSRYHRKQGFDNRGGYDGFNYRGRGFNGITGRAQYEKLTKYIGENLMADMDGPYQASTKVSKNPDKLNDITIAAKAAVWYFCRCSNTKLFASRWGVPKSDNGIASWNAFTSIERATLAILNCNAGMGNDYSPYPNIPDVTGGIAKAISVKDDMFSFVNSV